MALFPMFIDIKNKKVLIVGGGMVALRKIEKLIPFDPDLKVISIDFHPETYKIIKENSIPYEKRAFSFSDLDNVDIVIVAVDDIDLQREIFEKTRDKNILVNSVDSPDYCDFIFPAYVKRGEIVIGITTSGNLPGLSAKLRKHIEKTLPENLEEIFEQIKRVREKLPKGEERQKKILQLIDKLFE
ncbi:precorrin-2 dehydrogenase / sirohydrochlorin ferrochelatase [Persephonella hydrogeniphila]|uniref:precorrin-2 dehydrogenase n=1 Tax=Persephonella hydrogeniphila TaxID=198703 RepID=A0A285NGE8_9AQUI|nr:bifunctional precorrin-2 dehydrogenase/sirohydrochlorin ferrochelatase [Persephonella hydrogeniphila]SNZ08582.1 precorrin-2 dehydrogenase / sirohydrochlorin ferrochelatase [Persephonella hydrogeniphila]